MVKKENSTGKVEESKKDNSTGEVEKGKQEASNLGVNSSLYNSVSKSIKNKGVEDEEQKPKSKNKKVEKPKTFKIFALIYSKNNLQPDKVDITGKKDFFNYKDKSYFIKFNEIMVLEVSRFFRKDYYLFYYYNNPNPIDIKPENLSSSFTQNKDSEGNPLGTSVIDTTSLNTVLTSNVMNKIEKGGTDPISMLLENPKYLIIGGILIAIVIYVAQGGSIA